MMARKIAFHKTLAREDFRKYVFLMVIVLLLLLSYMILRDYLISLLSGFILAYLVRPIYTRLYTKLGTHLTALLCVVLIVLIIIVPFGLIVGGITRQAGLLVDNESVLFLERLVNSPLLERLHIDADQLANEGITLLTEFLASALVYVPSIIIKLLITLFTIYYVLLTWDSLAKHLRNYLPFKDRESIVRDISSTTDSLVYGTVLIALIEFIVAGIGFYILGVQFFLLISLLIFFLAFIPGLGPALVWILIALYYGIIGEWWVVVGVVGLGLILSLVIDAFLRVKILGGKARINPLLMIVSILGGISVFGIFGFIIGPLVLVYTLKLLEGVIRKY